MPNWHQVPDRQRKVELNLCAFTNMSAAEIGGLLDALCVSLEEFGKEHIAKDRWEHVHIRPADPGGWRVIED